MLTRKLWRLALLFSLGLTPFSIADVLRLGDNAAIAGKILAEKPDQVVIDIGYTVLSVPRTHIVSIESGMGIDAPEPAESRLMQVKAMHPTRTLTVTDPKAPANDELFRNGDGKAPERTVRDLVSELGEAVVQVRTPSGLGSGFIINEEGFLITNFHVIESETQIGVDVYHQKGGQIDRGTYKQVRIVAANKFADLALLKIEDKDAPKFASVPLGRSEELGVGERVFAIGSPLGLERTVTEGIVSSKTRPMQGELYLQTTTQINPGNSGGPLFNLRGEVVGVTNMKVAFGEGIGFAIPAHTVTFFLNHRDAYAYDNDNPSSPYRYLEPPSRLVRLAPDNEPSGIHHGLVPER